IVGLDVVDPCVDLVEIAHGFGAGAFRIERLQDVGDAVREALESGGPVLLDLSVSSPPAS
ncbi:MAG: thiamine pyrophosphate-dependent enzyme, partial [Acidimicrobiales bacterium]